MNKNGGLLNTKFVRRNMEKGSKTIYLIGERFQNNRHQWFTIVGYPDDIRRRTIKFDTGCEYNALISQIKNGKIKNYDEKSYYGIASPGMKNATKHPLFNRWTSMLGRCYNPKFDNYKFYGAKGVTVSDELLNFKNYVDIVSKLPNYDKFLDNPNDWQIDKDKKSNGECLIYSKETISILPSKENLRLENMGKAYAIEAYDDDGYLVAVFASIRAACKIFETEDRQNLARAVRNNWKYLGYWWRKRDENVLYEKRI